MPHRDLDHLVSSITPSAKEMIARHHALHPFGAHMTPEGEVVTHAVHAPHGGLGAHGAHGAHGAPAERGATPARAARASHDSHDPHHPHVMESIERITGEFKRQAHSGEARAIGLCTSVRTIPPGRAHKTHAICIGVEHQSGDAMDVYIPYEKGWFGRIRFGAPFSQTRRPRIFDARVGAQPSRRV